MKTFNTAILLCLMSLSAAAGQFKSFDNLEVHYSAIPSTFITPEIAANYQIQRSKYRALLNISILDTQRDNTAVIAALKGKATNLIGHEKTLSFREVKQGDAIYYLSEFNHTNEEQFTFIIDVTTAGGITNQLTFNQTFYVN